MAVGGLRRSVVVPKVDNLPGLACGRRRCRARAILGQHASRGLGVAFGNPCGVKGIELDFVLILPAVDPDGLGEL